MKIIMAISKLRRTGFTVTESRGQFTAAKPGFFGVIEFSRNGDSDEFCCLRARRENDVDESQSDYSAGCWCDSVKYAIEMARKMDVWHREYLVRKAG